eukprot:3438668-Rhodomonas_salina.1
MLPLATSRTTGPAGSGPGTTRPRGSVPGIACSAHSLIADLELVPPGPLQDDVSLLGRAFNLGSPAP